MPLVYQPPPKPEFSPLLPIGRWPFQIGQIRELCVTNFPRSTCRDGIMCCLEHVHRILLDAGIVGEIWVDGSFLTEKIDPDDTDLVLCMPSAFAENMTPDQRAVELWFADPDRHLKRWLNCHCFSFVRWPDGDPNYWEGEYDYCYWMRQWGMSPSDIRKGIAVLELT